MKSLFITLLTLSLSTSLHGQIGSRFPSERKVVTDPVTGVELVFLTSKQAGDAKIYPTHAQWTADGKWVIFRSDRVKGEAMAVNEDTGDLVQVTEGGYYGDFCIGQKSMKLFVMRKGAQAGEVSGGDSDLQILSVDLEQLFADSAAGTVQDKANYETLYGTIPASMKVNNHWDLDATENIAYFGFGAEEAARHLPENLVIEEDYGPRNMGAGPTGIAKMDLRTGEIGIVTVVGFQIGHIQASRYVPGQVVFCWETGGKSPQRTWIVNADGTGLRPLYKESSYEWVTHEAITGPNEVAFAILGHRKPGEVDEWGQCGSRDKPTGLAIINTGTGLMKIEGQTDSGSGYWHVHASSDGRFACGDDFSRSIRLIDRRTGETMLLTTGHKASARDHVHPTFSEDGTRIQFQSAMLSEDNRSMNICVVRVPEAWLDR